LGATEKFKIGDYVNDLSKNEIGEIHSCEINEADFYVGSYAIGDRTRAFLKVQEACDYKCTFCTIPLARGISRSDTLNNVLKNAKDISDKGIKEIVLTGVNIGDFGKGEFGDKKHEHTFLDLVKALDRVEGIHRLRISSIEPNLLKNETIAFVSKSNSFVPHFHMPLQSGSDEILKQMKRRYLRGLYVDRVKKIKETMPHACIGVDVIVGFPGESNAQFLETYHFLNELDISYLHVFTYSERDNTPAALLADPVPQNIRKKRSKMLRALSIKKRRAFYEKQLGRTRTVLFEGENKGGYIYGFTENYVKVKCPWDPSLINTLHSVKLTEIDIDGLVRFEFVEQGITV
ncbi:MAG: MiaB/RimO family radical SAM methylthiotransferase, partial [Maribacter sp.]|nr:MiaB/RimO family radical SAM methylthiotransferase [Maribacter sp.]